MGLKDISEIKFFAKGKRGFVYTGYYKNKKVAVKIKNPGSGAVGRIANEARFMKLLNRYKIGPVFVKSTKKYCAYRFVHGDFILDFIDKNKKTMIKKVLKNVFHQLYIMDLLKINKEEMHRPLKHIVVTKKNIPVLLDFERCYYTEKPHNVTQFCQFIIATSKRLKEKGILIDADKVIEMSRNYKAKPIKKNFNCVLRSLNGQ